MAQDSTTQASNKALVQANFDCWKSGPLKAKLASIAKFSTRHALSIIAIAGVFAVVSGAYVISHFAINTDLNKLISPDLPWRQQELAFSRAFPESVGTISAVVDAPTSELADQASSALAQKLSPQTKSIRDRGRARQ
jgi:predicted RND superfamily exporter protein